MMKSAQSAVISAISFGNDSFGNDSFGNDSRVS